MTVDEHLQLAVDRTPDLPTGLTSAPAAFSDVETRSFDQSYIDFLDQQIALEPRGPQWTAVLRRRRDNLAPWRDFELVSCIATVGHVRFFLRVNFETLAVVHWENWDDAG